MERIYDGGQVGRSESIIEAAPLCAKYGIQAMNLPGGLLENPEKLKETDKVIKSYGLHWGMVATPFDTYSEGLSDAEFEKGLETMKKWAEEASAVGASHCYNHIWSGSNFREYDAQREWVLTRAEKLFNILDPCGIRYGFEFLGPVPLRNSFKYPFVNNLAGALSIADDISPRLGFIFDTYHWFCGTASDPGELYLAAAHVDRLVNFHVNDGIAGRKREEQQDLERAMPMTTGVIDAKRASDLFKSRGYKGLVLCEPMNFWRAEMKDKPFEYVVKSLAEGYQAID